MPAAKTRVLVFPPFLGMEPNATSVRFDFRTLGVQFWIADQLTALGLEGATGIASKLDGDTRVLTATTPPADDQIREDLVTNEARYGVLTSYTMLGEQTELAVARLVEILPGQPLRKLGRWTFAGERDADHFAGVAHSVMRRVAERIGVELQPSTWQQLFGTDDRILAGNFLTALGCHAAADSGVVLDDPEFALRSILSGVVNGMQPAIDVLPHLLTSLRASESAPDILLAAALRAALDAVPEPPASWQSIRGMLPVPPRGLPN